MELTFPDYLIILQNLIAILMLYLAMVLFIKNRKTKNILLFLAALIIYVRTLLRALSYYRILNVELLLRVGNIALINYMVDLILLLLMIFLSINLIRSQNSIVSEKDRVKSNKNE